MGLIIDTPHCIGHCSHGCRRLAENLAPGTLEIIAGGHFTAVTHARRVKALIAGYFGIRVLPLNPNGVGAEEGG